MSALDRHLVEDVAGRLRADPGLVEKDWHVTRAMEVLATLDHGGAVPAFGGGTSLSKAWGLIRRFSEDIDFKVTMPPVSRNRARRARGEYRDHVLGALAQAGFPLMGAPRRRDENRFFSAELLFPSMFPPGPGLRSHIRIEMSLEAPALPPVARPIGSLISQVQGKPPEIAAFPCVDPVETAADKLSALAWRVHARQRGNAGDDPALIRHVHDLAALRDSVKTSPDFQRLVFAALTADATRGGGVISGVEPGVLFAGMLERLRTDPVWATEYENFVDAVSFAKPEERVGFAASLAAVRDLVALFRA